MAAEPPHSNEEVNRGVTKSHPNVKRKEVTGVGVGRLSEEEEKVGGRSRGGTASYKSATPPPGNRFYGGSGG